MRRLAVLLFTLVACVASAADHFVNIDTRPGVHVGYWLMERPDATATVVLLPGGPGGIGMANGVPTSPNFLVRSRDFFAAAGYNVAIVGKPSDRVELDPNFRASAEHVTDLRMVVERLGKNLGKPVWLVGTSLGTISAAAGAIGIDPSSLAGIVLTSSVTGGSRTSPVRVASLDLAAIRVPVLVMHHKLDACPSCSAREAPKIVDGLVNAPVKKLVIVEGGGGARGDPCEPMHWHGYIGMEQEAVEIITRWMKDPRAGAS
jgi:pimeloyl-ACP methyl ester carboxylesterase